MALINFPFDLDASTSNIFSDVIHGVTSTYTVPTGKKTIFTTNWAWSAVSQFGTNPPIVSAIRNYTQSFFGKSGDVFQIITSSTGPSGGGNTITVTWTVTKNGTNVFTKTWSYNNSGSVSSSNHYSYQAIEFSL